MDEAYDYSELDLLKCNAKDVDEHGGDRPGLDGMVCRPCRITALLAQISNVLHDCAYGGPVRGMRSMWEGDLELRNYAYEDYVNNSLGIAVGMAHLAVEEQWMGDHTRWYELLPMAFGLQKGERRLMRHYLRSGEVESTLEQNERLCLQARIRGEEEISIDNDEEEMSYLYKKWDCEAKDMDITQDEDDDEGSDWEEETLEPRVKLSSRASLTSSSAVSSAKVLSTIGQTTESGTASGSRPPTKSARKSRAIQRPTLPSTSSRQHPLTLSPVICTWISIP